MLVKKEVCLAVVFERRPVATDDAVFGDDGLENAAVVVSMVAVFWGKHDFAGLVTDEVLVVKRNQEVVALAETTSAAIICQIEFAALPFLCMNTVAKKYNASLAIADAQARPPDEIF